MGLTQALASSLQGLNATQTSLSIVAGNIANAQTPGYVAQSAVQVATSAAAAGDGVQVTSINRMLDKFVQQQLWTESSGGAYADLKASSYQQLQQVYGQPGSSASLDSVFNNFTSAVQGLSSTPSSPTARNQTIATAQALAQQLNSATSGIQTLRSQADLGISNDVQQANNAMQQIANINKQIASATANSSVSETLKDQRDQYISQLSKLMDIRVIQGGNNQVTVFTTSGEQLVGTIAAKLNFSASGTVTAGQQWSANPVNSGLSSVTLTFPSGTTVDLTASGAIRSGEIAAYLSMRDSVLVQAQGQIDQLAGQMSSALSDTTTAGTAVTVVPQSGFTTDIGGMLAGNTIQLSYTDAVNVQHNYTFVGVNGTAALPLSNSVTPNPNDTVIGVDLSGGAASVAAQLNTALGATGLQFSNPAGTTLQVLNNVAGTIAVNSVSTTTTATSLTGGSDALPFFTDGLTPYTGAITAAGSENTGYAGRIVVNPALVASPSSLVAYSASTTAGDPTRPNFIYNQLVSALRTYSPAAGIGVAGSPSQGTLSSYMSQIISTQSIEANAATNLKEGQDIVVNSLQARFSSTSAVNIDTEMANLLSLQNSYGANARVMSTVKSMLDTLMQAL